MDIKKILVPIDGSKESEKSLELAKQIAEKFDSEIILLNVVEAFKQTFYETHQYYNMIDVETLKEGSQKLLQESEADLKYLNTKIISVLGNPAEQIMSIAAQENVNLIIMATHGLGKIKKILIGSVTNKVVQHSKIPVLVLP